MGHDESGGCVLERRVADKSQSKVGCVTRDVFYELARSYSKQREIVFRSSCSPFEQGATKFEYILGVAQYWGNVNLSTFASVGLLLFHRPTLPTQVGG